MFLTTEEVCSFCNCTPGSRNFKEGERLLFAKHISKCNKKVSENGDMYSLLAFCVQTSGARTNPPHIIKGEISTNGKIINMRCSCKAGLSEKCKHIVGVLLYCSRNEVEQMEDLSCTDLKCVWKEPHSKALEQYEPAPLEEHECYKKKFSKAMKLNLSAEVKKKIVDIVFSYEESALRQHMVGRHPLLNAGSQNLQVDHFLIQAIINHPSSILSEELHKLPIPSLNECCKSFLQKLNDDPLDACIKSLVSISEWKKIRQFRITGSRCYSIYTYNKNKNPDWEQKSIKYFYPTSLKNKYVTHGLVNEPKALQAYETCLNVKITKCGFVICKLNKWLGYSPDGVLVENGIPYRLVEVKCPYDGLTMNISDVIKKQLFLIYDSATETVFLKEKHPYYGQIQLGMAILNVNETDFVIYSPFDNGLHVIRICIDLLFVRKLLQTVKNVYFKHMLHYACIKEKLVCENIEE